MIRTFPAWTLNTTNCTIFGHRFFFETGCGWRPCIATRRLTEIASYISVYKVGEGVQLDLWLTQVPRQTHLSPRSVLRFRIQKVLQ
jgi:hypothetical protein